MVSSFSATMISSFSATMITITRPGPQSEVMSDAHGPNCEAACYATNPVEITAYGADPTLDPFVVGWAPVLRLSHQDMMLRGKRDPYRCSEHL